MDIGFGHLQGTYPADMEKKKLDTVTKTEIDPVKTASEKAV